MIELAERSTPTSLQIPQGFTRTFVAGHPQRHADPPGVTAETVAQTASFGDSGDPVCDLSVTQPEHGIGFRRARELAREIQIRHCGNGNRNDRPGGL